MSIDKSLYISKNQDEINECFMKACLEGDLNLVKFLSEDPDLPFKGENLTFQDNIGVKISNVEACIGNNLDVLKYLFSLDENKRSSYLENRSATALSVAAAYGHLDIVSFILTDNDLEYVDLERNSNAFVSACGSNQLEIVKYLLLSPELKIHIPFEHYILGFEKACENNHVEIVKYLMEDLSLPNNIGEFNYKKIMKSICENNCVEVLDYLLKHTYLKENIDMSEYFINIVIALNQRENHNILQYMIFEENLRITPGIEIALKEHEDIKSWFKSRDLINELNNEIHTNPLTKKQKIKI